MRIFQKWDLRRKLANHMRLQFRSFLAKTDDWILHKVQKPYFWALSPIFEEMRIFPENPALSLFSIDGPITSCKISEKNNVPIPRKVRCRRTDGWTDYQRWVTIAFTTESTYRCTRGESQKSGFPTFCVFQYFFAC